MPRLHSSVAYCDRCDQYVATIEMWRCEECGTPVCPDCRKETDDPDLFVCSHRCAAKFRKSLPAKEAA